MRLSIIASILVFSTVWACRPSENKQKQQVKSSSEVPHDSIANIAYDTNLTHIADYIAGNIPLENLKSQEKKAVYSIHKLIMDSLFREAWVKNFSTMKEWAKQNIEEGQQKGFNLFYPFSGPDFYNAYYLFPGAENYYLFGLEPAGILPDSNDIKDPSFLKSISYSLRTTIAKNFFITREMNIDYGMKKDVGIATMLLLYAARTEHRVVKCRYILVPSSGKAEEYSQAEMLKNKLGVKGVKLSIIDSHGYQKNITYLSFNAENGKISPDAGVGKILNSIEGKTYGLLKAASYLMHYDGFSVIRKIFIDKCRIVMSDDSGLPYEIMTKNYKTQLFGQYSSPISEFNFINLSKMKEAYAKDTIKSLPFKFGYGEGKKVMVGKR